MNLVNQKVKHNIFGAGVVTEHQENYITVAFANRTTKFVFPSAFKSYLSLVDTEKQTALLTEIATLEERDRICSRAKTRKNTAIETATPKNTAQKIPLTHFLRMSGKRKAYYVFQGKTFDKEYRGGYMWAPITNKVGTVPHHWARMTEVRKGDIIFHGCNGYIRAISVAKDSCYECAQPQELTVEDMWDRDGRRIDCDYTYLPFPVKPSDFACEIKKYSSIKYSPFQSDGSGNMGYLFDLRPELAKLFVQSALKRNTRLLNIDYIKEFLNQ